MQCSIVELRQYTLHRGRRDELIALFERELLEAQEAAGMTLIGQFRALDDADRFVWLRGFPDMQARARALTAFYDGAVWAANRNAANATMLDSDNVLLLRPARADAAFTVSNEEPFPIGDEAPSGAVYVAGISYCGDLLGDDAVEDFGGRVIARYISEQSPNNYPRLPVREGVNAAVWFAVFADAAKAQANLASGKLGRSDRVEALRLIPTARSRLR